MNYVSPYSNYTHAILTANAQVDPDRIALSYRGQHYSYGKLDQEVDQLGNALLDQGIRPGMRVASLLSDALPIAKLYLAEAKIGAVIAALNPYWTEEVLKGVIERSEVDALVFDAANADVVARLQSQLPDVKWWFSAGGDITSEVENTIDLDAAAARASTVAPAIGASSDDAMAFFYTSGTTGLPKAVVHTHNSCMSINRTLMDLPRDKDSVWGTGPIIWGVGFPCTLGAAFCAGIRVALEDDFGPGNFLDAVQREGISHCALIPSHWTDLLSNYPHQNYNLDSLKVVLLGAEPLLSSLLDKIKTRVPQTGLYSFYGQTEAPYTCLGRLDDGSQSLESSGRARTGCAVRVVDAHGNRLIDEVGELLHNGPQRMAEYYGQEEKTTEVIAEDGWFRSGDLGVMDEAGFIRVLGRREDAIQQSNRFVRPVEIEDVALGIEGVGEAGAVGFPAGGEQQKILLAVSPVSGGSLNEEELRQQLKSKLPENIVIDKLVVAEELPHGSDGSGGKGKLRRGEIRELYGDGL